MIVSSTAMAQRLNLPDHMQIGDSSIPFSSSVKNLGFFLDSHLEMNVHIRNVVNSANFQLRRIASIRRHLTVESAATLVCSLVLSRMDYCNSLLFNCHDYLLDRMQGVQNNAARVILRVSGRAHITPHLMSLHWLPIRSRILYKLACMCHHCANNTAPKYLWDLLYKSDTDDLPDTPAYNTRLSSDTTHMSTNSLITQKTLGDRSFTKAAPAVWNSLPVELRQISDTDSFKSSLKTHLFRAAYE